jgi:tight adherence protein B
MTMVLPVVAVLLAVVGLVLCLGPDGSEARKQIESRVATVRREDLSSESEKSPLARLQWAARLAPLRGLVRLLALANWRLDTRILIGLALAVAASAAVLESLWGPIAAALGPAACLAAAFKVVHARGRRNVRRFNAHLPAFTERLRMILTAGSSLVSAFDKALDHSDPIVQVYLRPVAIRLSHGVNLADALRAQGNRLGIAELAMLAMVAHANMRFGGSLSDILDRLSDTVRGRNQAQQEFEAATAEVRSSSKVLFVLPILVVGMIFAIKPDYLTFFLEDPTGHALLGYAVGSVIVGALVLNRLQTIRY